MKSLVIKVGLILIWGVLLTFFFSCNSNENLNNSLQGLWNVQQANRNGKITYTLEGTYLKFSKGGIIETNIYGDSQSSRYKIENNILYPDSIFEEIHVDNIWEDTLLLHFTIDKNIFILKLVNKPENENNITN